MLYIEIKCPRHCTKRFVRYALFKLGIFWNEKMVVHPRTGPADYESDALTN